MKYSLNDLSAWFSHLLKLQLNEKELLKEYSKIYRTLEILHTPAVIYDSPKKLQQFFQNRTKNLKLMEKNLASLSKLHEEIITHCEIIPKGPQFKVTHSSGIYKISRDVAYIECFIYARGKFAFYDKIRYRVSNSFLKWDEG